MDPVFALRNACTHFGSHTNNLHFARRLAAMCMRHRRASSCMHFSSLASTRETFIRAIVRTVLDFCWRISINMLIVCEPMLNDDSSSSQQPPHHADDDRSFDRFGLVVSLTVPYAHEQINWNLKIGYHCGSFFHRSKK